jgi:hypothetical protein
LVQSAVFGVQIPGVPPSPPLGDVTPQAESQGLRSHKVSRMRQTSQAVVRLTLQLCRQLPSAWAHPQAH